jgi:hypothetical protein
MAGQFSLGDIAKLTRHKSTLTIVNSYDPGLRTTSRADMSMAIAQAANIKRGHDFQPISELLVKKTTKSSVHMTSPEEIIRLMPTTGSHVSSSSTSQAATVSKVSSLHTSEPAVQNHYEPADHHEDESFPDQDDSGFGTSANQLETGGGFGNDYSQEVQESKDCSSAGSGSIIGSPIIKKGKGSNIKNAVPKNRVRSALLGSGIQFIMVSGFVNGAKGRKLLPSNMLKTSVDDINLVQVNYFPDSPYT